ncbi:uncharacterized protein LOC118181848 isoform X1 [Stegodyphus dumicola]|uniref:uncharacterized protein LOC118181848 isoform X1 n=1 Tax=Stegodyphus dumicola TaxID=202533 RepID=UPI0015B3553A|nr:uncharacterized protein LOC118181848 isoform X1 [Stegodyphus dumicola]
MDYKENPVRAERIIKEIINKERQVREKWMMDHGVKYYKYPFEYDNFYGLGLSTPTPGPMLTRTCPISLHCGGWDPWHCVHPKKKWQCTENSSSHKISHPVRCDMEYFNKREKIPNGHICLPYCPSSPEFRFGVCSNCFYQYSFQ